MDLDQTSKALISLGGGLAAIGGAWKWLPKVCEKAGRYLEARRNAAFIAGMRNLRFVYDTLERAQDHGASRAIIFEAHNSGGIPRITASFYTSAVHWVSNDERDDARIASFIELPVDPAYIRMLQELQSARFYHFVTATESDSLLRRIYEASGVRSAAICDIGIIGNSYFYVSFARTETDLFSPFQLTELQLIAGTIKTSVKLK